MFKLIGHFLPKNCILKCAIQGNIEKNKEWTGRRRRGHKQQLDDLKKMRGYCKLKEEALDRTMWRTRCGRE